MQCATDWLLFASFSFGQTWYNFHIFPSWLPVDLTYSCCLDLSISKTLLKWVLLFWEKKSHSAHKPQLAKACPSGRLTWKERWTFEGTTHIVYIKLRKNVINAQHHICPQKTPNHWYTKKLLIEKPTNALWSAQCVYNWLFSVFFVEIIQMCINLLLYGASRGWHLTFVDASVLLLCVLDLDVMGIGD